MKRILTITVILPYDRVLTYRNGVDSEWQVTVEKDVTVNNALDVFNASMWDIFGVDTKTYRDNFANIRRLAPINRLPEIFITPFIVELKSSLAFESGVNDFFTAKGFNEVLNDVMSNTVYKAVDKPSKHTLNTVHLLKELHTKGVFK